MSTALVLKSSTINNLLVNKDEVGRGCFGAVFKAQLKTGEECVIKKMLENEIEDKKNFVKEARILQGLKHENIVGLKGIFNTPFALVLEYMYFDFKQFGDADTKVSSMVEFLTCVDLPEGTGFLSSHVFMTACKDIITPSWEGGCPQRFKACQCVSK